MKNLHQTRIAPTLISIAVALLLWMPSNRTHAQDEVAASASKTKVTFPTKVIDSKNKTVGTYQPINETFGPYGILDTALVVINGTALQLPVGTNGFGNTCANVRRFYFSESDCTGAIIQVQNGLEGSTPLAIDEVSGASGCVEDNFAYYPQAPYASMPVASYGSGTDPDHVSCNPGGGTIWGGTVVAFDLSKLNLKPPFKLK